jgi:hypothetical protein
VPRRRPAGAIETGSSPTRPGECPHCGGVAGDPGPGQVLDNTEHPHERKCPVSVVRDEDERWVDPSSEEMRRAMLWNMEQSRGERHRLETTAAHTKCFPTTQYRPAHRKVVATLIVS